VICFMELCHNGRGHEAFKQGDFPRAIGIWSLALEAQEGPAAVILGNRSAAHARLGCWSEALHDAEQVQRHAKGSSCPFRRPTHNKIHCRFCIPAPDGVVSRKQDGLHHRVQFAH